MKFGKFGVEKLLKFAKITIQESGPLKLARMAFFERLMTSKFDFT